MELPAYSVSELNEAIGVLLERGFAPRFLVDGAVVKPVLKKGHLWFSLSDGDASIQAVAWASTVARLSFRPNDGDGVRVVGKLNFWGARASLSVQALDIRPSLSTVLRRFEQVKQLLESEGLLDPALRRPLPQRPGCIAILTSVPSSALADLLRTANQRWPACDLRVVPIPVQGDVEERICAVFDQLETEWQSLGIEAVVLARGGGSREDLSVFDGEQLARALLRCPVPVVSGIGHEDDVTIADLAADYRAATPTAAMVALLPDREQELRLLEERGRHWRSSINSGWSGPCGIAIQNSKSNNGASCCSATWRNGSGNCRARGNCWRRSHPNGCCNGATAYCATAKAGCCEMAAHSTLAMPLKPNCTKAFCRSRCRRGNLKPVR